MYITTVLVIIAAIIIYKVYQSHQEEAADLADEEGNQKLKKIRLSDKWRTIESWNQLIPDASGKQATVTADIQKILREISAPNLDVAHRKVSLSGMTNLFTGSRKQLVIENKRLYGYHVFVSVENYGTQLNVSWYLILKENLFTKLARAAAKSNVVALLLSPFLFILALFYTSRKYTIPEMMNMFDLEELTAYTTTVHHVVLASVENVMNSMNMDFTKVDTKSRGFLNIS